MDTLHNDFLMPLTEEKCILKRNCQSQNKHNKQINTCSWGISCSSPLRPPSPEARFVAFCSEKVFIFCILTKAHFAKKNITFLSPTCCMSCWIWLGLIAPKGPCNMVSILSYLWTSGIKMNMVIQIKVHAIHSHSFIIQSDKCLNLLYLYFIQAIFLCLE